MTWPLFFSFLPFFFSRSLALYAHGGPWNLKDCRRGASHAWCYARSVGVAMLALKAGFITSGALIRCPQYPAHHETK
ncbi:hypothetical protein V8C26DRAFT_187324 [Trichoderma gracile]